MNGDWENYTLVSSEHELFRSSHAGSSEDHRKVSSALTISPHRAALLSRDMCISLLVFFGRNAVDKA